MAARIDILWRDPRLLVIDKPAGLLSVPGPGGSSVVERLAEQGERVLAVHRLDRDVSGVLLFALDEPTRAALEAAFRERELEKRYWALAIGQVKPPRGALKFPILEERGFARVSARGKRSETRYATIANVGRCTELDVELVTGRLNQIRVHFAHAGFPLVGERKYARGKDDPLRAPRLALHAARLALDHPWSGERIEVAAPLPAELVRLRERAGAGR